MIAFVAYATMRKDFFSGVGEGVAEGGVCMGVQDIQERANRHKVRNEAMRFIKPEPL
jgi:riboflavin synthase alpha subunit